ncbi:MAG: TetR/AcrR family transcriptional regulator [Bacilli bacterium]
MTQKENDTKKRILSVALQLIKQHGFDSVTLNDICKASGISKHTFYYHFSSKDDLLIQFYTIPRDISVANLSDILTAPNCVEQFWKLAEPGIEFFEEIGIEIAKRILVANITRDIGTFSKSELQKDLLRTEIAIVENGQNTGQIRNKADAVELLWTYKMQTFGIITSWCISNAAFDIKNAMRSTMEIAFDVSPELRKGTGVADKLKQIHKQKNLD